MTITIASTSVEPIEVVLVTDVDPSASTVSATFVTAGADSPTPGIGTWVTGTWQTPVASGDRYRTPAWFTVSGLTAGAYDVWVHIDGATYDPVLYAARLKILA